MPGAVPATGLFNLTRYNLNRLTRLLGFKREAVEIIDCVAGQRKFIAFGRFEADVIKSAVHFRVMTPFSGRDIFEVIEETVLLRKRILVKQLNIELVDCLPYVSKKLPIAPLGAASSEAISCSAHLGVIIYHAVSAKEEISAELWLSCRILTTRFGAELILCTINAFAVELITGEIKVTMKPGQELRIDSSVYTALLDGLNVLHLYNGEWIFITPETIEVIISTGNNAPLTGEIIYREMFV
jgi:hypothetical protein